MVPLALSKGSKAELAVRAAQPRERLKVGQCEGRRKTSVVENLGASLDASHHFLPQLLWPVTSMETFLGLSWLDQSNWERKASCVGSLR